MQKYRFDNVGIALWSTSQIGVYLLFDGEECIYIGKAGSQRGIDCRLQSHMRGDEGPGTKEATHFAFEVCANPEARERELLDLFRAQNFGLLPRCNEKLPSAPYGIGIGLPTLGDMMWQAPRANVMLGGIAGAYYQHGRSTLGQMLGQQTRRPTLADLVDGLYKKP